LYIEASVYTHTYINTYVHTQSVRLLRSPDIVYRFAKGNNNNTGTATAATTNKTYSSNNNNRAPPAAVGRSPPPSPSAPFQLADGIDQSPLPAPFQAAPQHPPGQPQSPQLSFCGTATHSSKLTHTQTHILTGNERPTHTHTYRQPGLRRRTPKRPATHYPPVPSPPLSPSPFHEMLLLLLPLLLFLLLLLFGGWLLMIMMMMATMMMFGAGKPGAVGARGRGMRMERGKGALKRQRGRARAGRQDLCQKSERDGAQRRRCCECEWGRAERQKEGRGGQEGGKEGDGEGGQRGEARREKSEKILIIKATKNPHKLKRYKRTHAAKAHKHTHTGADVVAWLNIRQCVCVCVLVWKEPKR